MEAKHFIKKICLLGDPAVGKTSLIHRFVYDVFDDKYLATIGAKVTKKSTLVEFPESGETILMDLIIWDIAGQRMIGNVHQSYFRGAKGALVVADITRRDTFQSITNWISELFKASPGIPVLVLANKFDLQGQAEIDEQGIKDILGKLGASFLYTSAKDGTNVENAFKSMSEFLAREVVATGSDGYAKME